MTIITRFAPSPTGRLHVGNIRAALHNRLLARKVAARSCSASTIPTPNDRARRSAMRSAPIWPGWDSSPMPGVRQSDRFPPCRTAIRRASRRLAGSMTAYERPEELDLKPQDPARAAACRRSTTGGAQSDAADCAALEAGVVSRTGAFRLDHDAPSLGRPDPGPQRFDPALLSDPDGPPGRRQLALPAAERDRRHRPRHHPRRARRGSCHQ